MASTDRIILEGMLFFGRHGALPEERALGQHFEVDVEIEADLSAARASDRLGETIDYGEVYATVRGVMEGPSRNLLERLAEEIASRVMVQFPLHGVRVRVKKPRLPMRGGVIRGVSVEVYRTSATPGAPNGSAAVKKPRAGGGRPHGPRLPGSGTGP